MFLFLFSFAFSGEREKLKLEAQIQSQNEEIEEIGWCNTQLQQQLCRAQVELKELKKALEPYSDIIQPVKKLLPPSK